MWYKSFIVLYPSYDIHRIVANIYHSYDPHKKPGKKDKRRGKDRKGKLLSEAYRIRLQFHGLRFLTLALPPPPPPLPSPPTPPSLGFY